MLDKRNQNILIKLIVIWARNNWTYELLALILPYLPFPPFFFFLLQFAYPEVKILWNSEEKY